ncbi:hypothetical protein HYR54_03900 [Candidatus Acetothermia bacterium]|nr:hypothetical protein [Candidatus Acetothermia bacterium]
MPHGERTEKPVKSGGAALVSAAPNSVLLVYGAGSGLGKSTLACALVQWMESRGLSTRLFSEECATEHPAFRAYVRQVQTGNAGDAATLLKCCDRFIAELLNSSADVVVLDSLLPCWDWLYSAGASDEVVADFTDDLKALLSKLRPVLLLVEGDVDQALERAIEDRGIEWALDLAERRAGQRDRDSLQAYFQTLRAGTGRAMSRWNYPVVRVDTVVEGLESAVRRTSEELAKWLPSASSA